jgi:hypothetical protein
MSGFDPSESADHDVPPHPRRSVLPLPVWFDATCVGCIAGTMDPLHHAHPLARPLPEPVTPAAQSLVDVRRDLEDALQELDAMHERRTNEIHDRLAEVDGLIRRQWALDDAEVNRDMEAIGR